MKVAKNLFDSMLSVWAASSGLVWVCLWWRKGPHEPSYTSHGQYGSVKVWYWCVSAITVHWIHGSGQKLSKNCQWAFCVLSNYGLVWLWLWPQEEPKPWMRHERCSIRVTEDQEAHGYLKQLRQRRWWKWQHLMDKTVFIWCATDWRGCLWSLPA
jgi:hypothetical protein